MRPPDTWSGLRMPIVVVELNHLSMFRDWTVFDEMLLSTGSATGGSKESRGEEAAVQVVVAILSVFDSAYQVVTPGRQLTGGVHLFNGIIRLAKFPSASDESLTTFSRLLGGPAFHPLLPAHCTRR